jgi:hypothetical protein
MRKNRAAVALSKLRMTKISPERRKEIASIAGTARARALSKEQATVIGRKAGKVGGRARAETLSGKRRSEIAKKAAAARWTKSKRS